MGVGVCGVWAMRDGDFTATEFAGTQVGLTAAIAYCGSNGVVQVYPGNGSLSIPTLPSGVFVHVHEAGGTKTYGGARQEFTSAGARRNVRNVMDYSSVGTAIAAASSDGGAVFFPAGTHQWGGPLLFDAAQVGTKKIKLFGEGIGRSVLQFWDTNADMLTMRNITYCEVEDLSFVGSNSPGAGRGLVIDGCHNVHIRRCYFDLFPSYGLAIVNPDGVQHHITSSTFSGSRTNGVVHVANVFGVTFDKCVFLRYQGTSPTIVQGNTTLQLLFNSCAFETDADINHIRIDGARQLIVQNCWFESTVVANPPAKWFVDITGGAVPNTGIRIIGNRFVRTGGPKLRALKLTSDCFVHFENNDAEVLGAPSGTDDISPNNSYVWLVGENVVSDTAYSVRKPFRIDYSLGPFASRLADDFRFSLIPISTAARNALTDLRGGDIILNGDTAQYEFYNGTSWRSMNGGPA